jgi:hypothetical protein
MYNNKKLIYLLTTELKVNFNDIFIYSKYEHNIFFILSRSSFSRLISKSIRKYT